VCPNVILAASAQELAGLVTRTRERAANGEVLLLEYPEEGFTTVTDEEYRAAVARLATEAMMIRGCLVYGPRKHVNALTRGLELWK
jgi:hypothetical protein